jgi:hypothetical protein
LNTHRLARRGALGVPGLLLLFTFVAVPALAQDDYPRLGLYGHVDGRGVPVIDTNGNLDVQMLDNIARRHLVVLDATPFTEYRPDMLPALRSRRAGIKVLGYVQANYIFRSSQADSTVNLPTRIRILVRNANGFLYNQNGEEYDAANINLAKRDAQGRYVVAEALADFFVDHVLVAGGWDGLYFDRYCTTLAWMQVPGAFVDHLRAGYASFSTFDTHWQAGSDTLANRMRRRAGNTPIFIGNCGQGNKYSAFNGWMRENFPYQNGGTWETNLLWNVGGYLTDEPKFRAPAAGWMTAWPVDNTQPYSTENMRRARYVLGSAALGDGYGSLNPPDIDPTTGYMNWWYDENAVHRLTGQSTTSIANTGWLGRASGPMRQMMWIQPGVEDAGQPNPNFETSVSGWVLSTNIGATVIRDVSTAGDGLASARITMPGNASDPSSVRFTGTTSVLYAPGQYSATFWAKASQPRSIGVLTVNPTTGVPVWWNLLNIGTTWKRYQVLFDGTAGSVKLEFRLGASPGDVWLDDVHFQRGAPNIYRRDFEYGVVLVNPANRTWDVALERTFRRISGTRDPVVNNGTESNLFSMPPATALFLLKPVTEMIGVDEPARAAASGLAWSLASPSPARAGADVVRMTLAVAQDGTGRVDVYDARGRLVRGLFAGPLAAGPRAFTWDGRDAAGRAVTPGVYFARASTGSGQAVRKLVLR